MNLSALSLFRVRLSRSYFYVRLTIAILLIASNIGYATPTIVSSAPSSPIQSCEFATYEVDEKPGEYEAPNLSLSPTDYTSNSGFTFANQLSHSWSLSVSSSSVAATYGSASLAISGVTGLNWMTLTAAPIHINSADAGYQMEMTSSITGSISGASVQLPYHEIDDVSGGVHITYQNGFETTLANLSEPISANGNLSASWSGGGGGFSGDLIFLAQLGTGSATLSTNPPPPRKDPKGPPTNCQLAAQKCKNGQCPGDDTSAHPINYATGEVLLRSDDVSDPAGAWLSVSRSYDNLVSADYDGPNGWNWFTDRIPYVVQTDGTNNHVVVMTTPSNSVYFDLSGGAYVPTFPVHGTLQTLTHDSTAHTFRYTETSSGGNVQKWLFRDCDQTTYTKGIFASYTDPFGVTTAVTAYYNGTIGQLSRATTSGATTTIYSLLYNYYQSGSAIGKIQQTTLQHSTDGTTWTVDRQVQYSYYDGTDANGSINDLKAVVVQDPSAATIDTSYYRYWTSTTVSSLSATNSGGTYTATATTATAHGLSIGGKVTITGASDAAFNGTFTIASVPSSTQFTYVLAVSPTNTSPTGTIAAIDATKSIAHGLKYVVGPASFSRLVANVGDPTTTSVTDTNVALYCDNYFEYDGRVSVSGSANPFYRAVTKEIAQGSGCSCSGSGGQGTFTYTRTINTNGGYSDGYNTWKYKTVETLPDSNTNTVYGNYASGTILKVFTDTTSGNKWGWFYQRNSRGLITLEAQPSAVALPTSLSTIEAYNDLLHNVSGDYQYLNNSTGLINVHDYATTTTATSSTPGNVQDYLQDEKVQQGDTSTTPVLVKAMAYTVHTADASTSGDGLGGSIYPVANEVLYRNTDGSGGMTTSYTYTWQTVSGLATTAMASRTTSLPTIGSGQNGPGSADVTTEVYDLYGRVIWTKDGDLYLTYISYDNATGAVLKTIRDVNTANTGDFANLPSGWSTPSGGGLHLISTMSADGLGRTTKTTDPNGNIAYTVYKDSNHEVRVYPGWQTGTSATTGPTQVSREDRPGSYVESLTMAASPHVTSSVPDGSESVASIQSLSRQYRDNSNRAIKSDSYFNLTSVTYSTSVNIGTLNTNYYRTTYDYDTKGRRSRVLNAVGTITRTVYDSRDRIDSVWIGTNDTPSSGFWDPSNNTSPSNMLKVTQNVYDGAGVGDGTLTKATQFPDSSGTQDRVSLMFYDWRDRLMATKSGWQTSEDTTTHRPINFCDLDNLGRCTTRWMYDGDGITVSITSGVPVAPSSSLLRSKTVTSYDDQGRVYRTQVYSVDQSAGTVSTYALTSNTWFDYRGETIKIAPPGAAMTKMVYDGAGRMTKRYTTDGGGDTAWSDASSLSGDIVLQQSEQSYDGDGNVIFSITRQRFNDDASTATGVLVSTSTSPKAWVGFSESYYDAVNRETANASLGRVSGDSYTRDSSVPSRSDTVLVTSTAYNSAGWVDSVTDPKAIVTKKLYDVMGRVITSIDDYTSGTPTSATDRSTSQTYDGVGHVLTLTAVMPSGTASQTTQYDYGVTTSGGNGVNSNDLLAKVRYPDRSTGSAGTGSTDQVLYTYNALGQGLTTSDQNGSTHSYAYDILGRRTSDTITTLGSGVDGAVRRQTITFDTGGRPYQLTSYDATSGGTVVNQVQQNYNGLGQLTHEYQSHSLAVNTSTTPQVQYSYTEMTGGANHSRLTSITYPNARVVYYLYAETGDTSGISDTISRVTALSNNTTRGTSDANVVAGYSYLGLNTPVRKDYPTPKVRLDLWGGTTGTYTGLDGFGRPSSQDWVNYNSTAFDVFKLNHGYDRDSNRLYAENTVYGGSSQAYQYDNLNRLTQYKAGLIKSDKSDIQDTWVRHSKKWHLDALGNAGQADIWTPSSYASSGLTPDWVDVEWHAFDARNEVTNTSSNSEQALLPATQVEFGKSAHNAIWQKVPSGSSDVYSVNNSTQKLNVTTVTQDSGEAQAQVVQIQGADTGPIQMETSLILPTGSTSGKQAGFVFGYKSASDYWLHAIDMDQTQKLYHVVSGTRSLLASTSWAQTAGSETWNWMSGSRGSLAWPQYNISAGFPSGKIGLYTNAVNTSFDWWAKGWDNSQWANLSPKWMDGSTSEAAWDLSNAVQTTGRLKLSSNLINRPVLLKDLRLSKYQIVFSIKREQTGNTATYFVCNAKDGEAYNAIAIYHNNAAATPDAYKVLEGSDPVWVTQTQTSGNASAATSSQLLWVRVTCDGTTTSVQEQTSSTAPSTWSAVTTNCDQTTALPADGGMIGFLALGGAASIGDIKLYSANPSTGAFDVQENYEAFSPSSGYLFDTLANDSNGNLTYDGKLRYTYDGWNRLVKVAAGYRDSGGTLQTGRTFETIAYDARGRRTSKAVSGTGAWDATYHYYLNQDSQIETRNGSGQTVKVQVWGLQYIDELVQQAVNSSPATQSTCDTLYWACQDANWNVLGLTGSTGTLVERYEYTPYGQRTVFFSPGANDTGCFAPTLTSRRVVTSGSVTQPYGLCDFGHQGLMHDEETGQIFSRARMLNPSLGRWMQQDPKGYVDGLELYEYLNSSPSDGNFDPFGLSYREGWRGLSPDPTDPNAPTRWTDSSGHRWGGTGRAIGMPISGGEIPYEPDKWNDPKKIREKNCYGYACNDQNPLHYFPQPGRGAGLGNIPFGKMNCREVVARSIADGLVKIGCDDCLDKNHYKVVLVVAPGVDYHWYRQDPDGNWSHKPGETPARDRDESGQIIIDPRLANRDERPTGDPNYTDVCGCFSVPTAGTGIK